MPGPPVGHILTSDDVGLGTNEMKVKGTYVTPTQNKYISSRFLFTSEEEEKEYFEKNPEYYGYLDLDDLGKPREPDIPYRIDKQIKNDIGEKVVGSPPKKPKFPVQTKSQRKALRPYKDGK